MAGNGGLVVGLPRACCSSLYTAQPLQFAVCSPEHRAHLGGVSLVLRHSDVMWLPPHLTHL